MILQNISVVARITILSKMLRRLYIDKQQAVRHLNIQHTIQYDPEMK